ncbi:MAG: hypothetical protein CO187_02505 [Zetaproteobacteria bacterium CG_4_9_14_3_um_filter_53_7]|nr:MAG: hypothetical protein CO187_02505 [Zetaproteobacteria bacterium CG_4_9_14_3_um_filter_53_7]
MADAKSIYPRGEAMRMAVRWLSEMHHCDLETIEEACRRYDLTPCEEEFMLKRFLSADHRKVVKGKAE